MHGDKLTDWYAKWKIVINTDKKEELQWPTKIPPNT